LIAGEEKRPPERGEISEDDDEARTGEQKELLCGYLHKFHALADEINRRGSAEGLDCSQSREGLFGSRQSSNLPAKYVGEIYP